MAERITYSGMTFEEHRACFPERWRKRSRAWSFFWWSMLLIPLLAALNWLFGNAWERTDTYLCVGWAMSRFWVAFDPDAVRAKTTWFLDQPTAWQKLKAAIGK